MVIAEHTTWPQTSWLQGRLANESVKRPWGVVWTRKLTAHTNDSPKVSARSLCLGLSEMRCAIAEHLEDDDLRELSQVSRAWRADIANGPAYKNILRHLLEDPSTQAPLPALPAHISYMGVVLLLRQVQQDPDRLRVPEPDMLWLTQFLQRHYPFALDFFGDYKNANRQARISQRHAIWTRIWIHGAIGLTCATEMAIVSGLVALACEPAAQDAQSYYGWYAPLGIAAAVLWATCVGIFEVRDLMPGQADAIGVYAQQRDALLRALYPPNDRSLRLQDNSSRP